jgi:hypothetical protein
MATHKTFACFIHPGLCAHGSSSTALPIIAAIIASELSCLLVALALRPFISTVLNFLEVACGAIDVALLALIAVVYRVKAQAEAAAGGVVVPPPPGAGQQQQQRLNLPQVCMTLTWCM